MNNGTNEKKEKQNVCSMRPGLSPGSLDLCNLYHLSPFPLVAGLGCEDAMSRATLLAFSRDTSLPPASRAIGRPAGVGAPQGFMACRTVSTTALGVDRGARDG